MSQEEQQPESYEPTPAAQRQLIQREIRAVYENLFVLQAQHRVHTRLKQKEMLKSIEATMAIQEGAIAELRLILAEIPAEEQAEPA